MLCGPLFLKAFLSDPHTQVCLYVWLPGENFASILEWSLKVWMHFKTVPLGPLRFQAGFPETASSPCMLGSRTNSSGQDWKESGACRILRGSSATEGLPQERERVLYCLFSEAMEEGEPPVPPGSILEGCWDPCSDHFSVQSPLSPLLSLSLQGHLAGRSNRRLPQRSHTQRKESISHRDPKSNHHRRP